MLCINILPVKIIITDKNIMIAAYKREKIVNKASRKLSGVMMIAVLMISLTGCVGVNGALWSFLGPGKNLELAVYETPRFVNPDWARRTQKQVKTWSEQAQSLFLPEYPYRLYDWKSCASRKPFDIDMSRASTNRVYTPTKEQTKSMFSYLSHLASDSKGKLQHALGELGSVFGGTLPAVASATETTTTPEPEQHTQPSNINEKKDKEQEEEAEPSVHTNMALKTPKSPSLTDQINRSMNKYKGALFHPSRHLSTYSPFPSIRRQTERALNPLLRHLEFLTTQGQEDPGGLATDLMLPAAQFLQMVNSALHLPKHSSGLEPTALFDSSWAHISIPFDVKESADSYRIIADMPAGVTSEDICVELSPHTPGEDTLCTVTFTRKDETTTVDGKPVYATKDMPAEHKVVHRERRYGQFRRVFQLPDDVTEEEKSQVAASVNRKHELEITIPRKPQPDPVHIKWHDTNSNSGIVSDPANVRIPILEI